MTPDEDDRAATRGALEAGARANGKLVSVCMICGAAYGTKNSDGSQGGLSHGLCDACEDEWGDGRS